MPETILQYPHLQASQIPLCVDLDGTLVKSDTLIDSLLVMVRTRPSKLFALPGQMLRGKAAFKAFVTDSIVLDVVHLPYNQKVLQYLRLEHAQGRAIYLATGANVRLADRVSEHLGIFCGVLGSNGETNFTGNNKLNGLRNHLASDAFDYIGNASPDLPLLAHATESMVANPSMRLRMGMRARGIHPKREFQEGNHPVRSILKAIRIHQWAKNALIFVPLLLSHHLTVGRILTALLAFCCFSFTASATYVVNDLLDIEADRRHHRKKLRPFASGDLSAYTGIGIVSSFFLLAVSGARFLPPAFYGWLLFYLIASLAYSSYLKRIPIVDVLVLSGLYTLRLQAGSAATQTPISHWLAGFSIFLFLSLAFVKRFAELENLQASALPPTNGRGYLVSDIEQMRSFGTASAYAAVVIFAIYISGSDVMTLYRKPSLLWLVVPFMILWVSRMWLLASRGELNEDPVVFAITDRVSLLIGLAVVAIVLLAL